MAVINANLLPSLLNISLGSDIYGSVVLLGVGDNGFISGIVTEQGKPVSRRVICYHRRTGARVASTWSSDDGKYRFDNLIADVTYLVTSVDENNDAVQYNAVTQDLITASEVVR